MSTSSAVRQRQSPLIRRYREAPDEAMVSKRARTVADVGDDPFHVSVAVDGPYEPAVWRLGIDRKVGGDQDLANPAELLLASLAGCHAATLRMVADNLGVEIGSLEVVASGQVDARGCLGVDPDVRVGFEAIELAVTMELAGSTDDRRLKAMQSAADRLCVTSDTLRRKVEVTASYTIDESPTT